MMHSGSIVPEQDMSFASSWPFVMSGWDVVVYFIGMVVLAGENVTMCKERVYNDSTRMTCILPSLPELPCLCLNVFYILQHFRFISCMKRFEVSVFPGGMSCFSCAGDVQGDIKENALQKVK